MTTSKLPVRLKKEPLVEALFEMRFTAITQASSILPGVLFGQLGGKTTLEQLPSSQIPRAILESDPNLRFAPLVRLNSDKIKIAIGDRSLSVSAKLPYPGWGAFSKEILTVLGLVERAGIVQAVHRISMKYIDLIPMDGLAAQVSAIQGTVVLGKHTLKEETFTLRIEIPENDMLHIVQVAASAKATLPDGSTREGVIVDTDTIRTFKDITFGQCLKQLPDDLESLHSANKAMFFECLRPETVELLEPVYD
jgi:uncharacterized protein (TIGR04255 family)